MQSSKITIFFYNNDGKKWNGMSCFLKQNQNSLLHFYIKFFKILQNISKNVFHVVKRMLLKIIFRNFCWPDMKPLEAGGISVGGLLKSPRLIRVKCTFISLMVKVKILTKMKMKLSYILSKGRATFQIFSILDSKRISFLNNCKKLTKSGEDLTYILEPVTLIVLHSTIWATGS